MAEPAFRLVAPPQALAGAPSGWAAEMLHDGEVALAAGDSTAEISALAHELGQPAILVLRREADAALADSTVRDYAAQLPLIWVAPAFTATASEWARQRGPMTLLVDHTGPLSDEQRRTIDRFVASLGRQSE